MVLYQILSINLCIKIQKIINNIEAPIIDLSVPQRPYQFIGLKLTALIKYNLALMLINYATYE